VRAIIGAACLIPLEHFLEFVASIRVCDTITVGIVSVAPGFDRNFPSIAATHIEVVRDFSKRLSMILSLLRIQGIDLRNGAGEGLDRLRRRKKFCRENSWVEISEGRNVIPQTFAVLSASPFEDRIFHSNDVNLSKSSNFPSERSLLNILSIKVDHKSLRSMIGGPRFVSSEEKEILFKTAIYRDFSRKESKTTKQRGEDEVGKNSDLKNMESLQ
jgi:hypothetical protein